jgi:predicted transcriptional regulator
MNELASRQRSAEEARKRMLSELPERQVSWEVFLGRFSTIVALTWHGFCALLVLIRSRIEFFMSTDVIPLKPERRAQLEEYAARHGQDTASALDEALGAYLDWERQDSEEAVEGIRRGHEDVIAGRTRPASEVLAEMRRKLVGKWPRREAPEEYSPRRKPWVHTSSHE